MHLLEHNNVHDVHLTRDLTDGIPPYAILSHTWGSDEEEVTFQDLQNESGKEKKGFTKIRLCGEQAKRDGLTHFWVDTCCINKANHSQLSEAIISMYRWYKMASVCYVYLADVAFRPETDGEEPSDSQNVRSWKPAFRKSRWFTRGWTLQELIAPDSVVFYSKEWICLGTKATLEELIHEITGIPVNALRGRHLSNFSVAERMRWAKGRTTKKKEDQAYCLLGIFNVFLPPMYGEEENAFVRLNEEIDKKFSATSSLQAAGHEESDLSEQVHQGNTPQACHESGRQNGESDCNSTSEALLQERRKSLMNSLIFEQMDARRSTIKNAYASTCTWILQHSAYLNWIDPRQLEHHLGFLWINGKPGAGKSTMMKFLQAQTAATRSQSQLVISFFFNARGDTLERSTVGMYRGLLSELLQVATDLQDVLDAQHHLFDVQAQSPARTAELLHGALSAAVMRLEQRRLKIFIDALDECDEEQVREMVLLFEQLAVDALNCGTQLYICFASRHYPTIDIRHGQKLILEDEDGHSEDLTKYVQSHLRAGRSTYIEEVRKEIQQKANGVFMWAVLVVGILNEEFRRGRIFAVRKRLKEIPAKLSDLFKDILRRDSINMTDMLLCLQWILFAKRPLRPEEFYFAMVTILDTGPDKLIEWDPEQVSPDAMKNFILNSSKGLAELTKSKTPTVQFIHESIRDFLIKDNGLSELWPDLAQDLHSSSHDQLKQCCQNYLSVDISSYVRISEALPKPTSDAAKELRQSLKERFPFLEYASQNVLYHANEAADGIPQERFLLDFDLRRWSSITNVFAIYETRRHTLDVSLQYVMAENNFARLLTANSHHVSILHPEQERYRYALVAALANGHRDAVQALLQRGCPPQTGDIVARLKFGSTDPPRKDQTLLVWTLSRNDEALAEILVIRMLTMNGPTVHDFETRDKDGRTALMMAVAVGSEKIVRLLCDCRVDIEATDKQGRTALHYAAEKESNPLLRILLENQANIEARDRQGLAALQLAALKGSVGTVQLLLDSDSGTDMDARSRKGEAALILAAKEEHGPVIQLLLEQGADIQLRDFNGMTALLRAARDGKETVVKFLLSQEIDIETRDESGYTSLIWATIKQRKDTVQLLLARGADVEAHNRVHQTSLSYATARGDKEIVSILLEWNADPAVRDIYGKTPFVWLEQSFCLIHGHKSSWAAFHMYPPAVENKIQACQWQLMLLEQDRKGLNWHRDPRSCPTSSDLLEITKSMLIRVSKHDDIVLYRDRALIWAAQFGWQDLAQSLILDCADIEAEDEHGLTALWHAIIQRQYHVVEVLVAHGVDIELPGSHDITPLAFAVERNDDRCVAALLKCEVNAIVWTEIRERVAI